MRIQTINPPQLFNSTQYGFSQLTLQADGGNLFVTSGQVAMDHEERIIGTTLQGQMDRCMENLKTLLETAGGSLEDVLGLRIYVVQSQADNLRAIGEVLRRHFGTDHPPASTWIGVAFLARAGFLVEVEAMGTLQSR